MSVQRERGEGRALDDWEEEGRGGGRLDYLAGPTRPRHVHVSLFIYVQLWSTYDLGEFL